VRAATGLMMRLAALAAVSVVVGVVLSGRAGALAGDDSPPPDLEAEDPALFWQNLSPEQRDDARSEYPIEDGSTIPALSEAEAIADLERSLPPLPHPPRPSGTIWDYHAIHQFYQPVNGWHDGYNIELVVWAGYDKTAGNRALVGVWSQNEVEGERSDFYYPPGTIGPIKIVSANRQRVTLAAANDSTSRVILTFDLNRRVFSSQRYRPALA
jgi:hypothetical protein